VKEKPLQVLLVEDNAGDALLLREMFRTESPGDFELTHLSRMSEAVNHLAKGGVDIVLLDLGLPDAQGLDIVRRAHTVAPSVPLIVLTGLDDEILAAQAMKEGAQDYLIKGHIESRALPRALRHAIERHRMQTETDLIRKQQLQLKDEFLSHVSHELRSPLTAIYQFATILADKLPGELNPEQAEYLEIILRNVRQLQAMIEDLLEGTRLQEGKLSIDLQCASVSDAIAYTVRTLEETARSRGVNLSCDLPPNLPSIYADPTRVRQILIILVDNAIKFTPANGVVKVQARVLKKDPNFLLLEVSDSGCGISPDMTERVFERLYQVPDLAEAGRKGLGLGLYICKELVARQGGRIWVESPPGQGAVFSVTLPIFSLTNLIAPALRNDTRLEKSIVFVVTAIDSRNGWLSKEARAEPCQQVRDLLQRCLHSDLDVLLPKMGSVEGGELFFIVAAADEMGGEALTRRIREQLQRCEQIQQAGLTFSVYYRLLELNDPNQSTPDLVDRVAREIQEIVDQEISPRMVKNE
jgi:signal transduction histidine kinase